MKKKIHIISHTHWDREWYLSSRFVNRWIPVFFKNLFRMLEKEPDYRFVLDGQTAIIDDCCDEFRKNGRQSVEEFLDQLAGYVRDGRIIIGPYYLQPDWQLISDESLVRNMLYGKEIAERLGGRSDTGWLLDNFGQISQTAQIHQQFGMKGLVVWRGVGFPPDRIRSEFFWEAPDGTRMPAVYLLSSYRNGMRLAENPDSICGRIVSEADKIESFALTDNILLMNGYDQEMEPDDILPYIRGGNADTEKYEVVQSTPDEYFEAVNGQLENAEVPVLSGPLYSGRYISVFPGILSSRMYLKTQNDLVQRTIEEEAEPLGVMSRFVGGEYPSERLESGWKLLLKNHPHDSICGVSVDDVHSDMEIRFEAAAEEADECIGQSIREISSRIDTEPFAGAERVFHVFNTTLCPQKRQIFLPVSQDDGKIMVRDENGKEYACQKTEGGTVAEAKLPAFGFVTLGVYREGEKADPEESQNGGNMPPVLENKYLCVEFQANGTFWLTDRKTGKVYKDMGYLEDSADSGDEYNFSYVKGDVPKNTLAETADISVVESGALRTVVKISYRWELPCGLSDDRKRRSEEVEIVPVSVFVTLEKDSRILKIRTKIRNRCRDHRIRVMFPTGIHTDCSYARTQFDITRHEIIPEQFDDSDLPENVKRIVVGAREREPITQFPHREAVAVTDGKNGVSVLNKGLPEYEVLPDQTTIALTLFRGVSWLARTDLNTRIGDAGPEIFTPEAQCLRDMEFEYGISLFEGGIEDAYLLEKGSEMNQLYPVAETTVHRGDLSPVCSFFELEGEGDIRVTAVKQAEDKKGVILRCFHVGEKTEKVVLKFGVPAAAVYLTDLAEEKGERLDHKEGRVELEILPRRITTLRVIADDLEKDETELLKNVHLCGAKPEEWDDMEKYPVPAAVTGQDMEREETRAKKAEADYQMVLSEYEAGSEKEMKSGRAAQLKLNMEIRHRTALEARLSAIYTQIKLAENVYGKNSGEYSRAVEAAEPRIRELADDLNKVRVQRRASEYWADYYLWAEKK